MPTGQGGSATMARGSTEDDGAGGAAGAEVHTFPDPPGTESAALTPRQRKVLEVIRDWVERFGYPPSVREIGDAVGLTSTSSVHHQLRALERKGYLRRDPNRTRAVDVRGPDEGGGEGVLAVGADDHPEITEELRAMRPSPAFVPV